MKIPKVINFKVKPGRDDDIINWLVRLGEKERSFYIRLALREWLQGKGSVGIKAQVHEENEEVVVSEDELNKRLDGLDF